jgi:hypothetical protein
MTVSLRMRVLAHIVLASVRMLVFTGHKTGFQAEVRLLAPHVNFIRCIIHREALASRGLQPQLHVLQEVVKVVNFVKACPLNSRLFAVFCEEMQADRKCMLYS